jgi:phosphoglycolate phosphatase-like HAD superfamily hydrolase
MTNNFKALLNDLQQSVNKAILESQDVAAAMAALKRIGKSPVFTVDIAMEEPNGAEPRLFGTPMIAEPTASSHPGELILSDWDVEFLANLGISDSSWCPGTSNVAGH